MLSVNSYAQDYVDACRSRVAGQLAAYERLAAAARDREAALDAALADFEPVFFNTMALSLDSYFCHRSRMMELKDGNPLNEVRVLCSSMLQNGSIFTADKTIKLKPETSILGYAVGDEIRLHEPAFTRLAEAFFAEIERKYP